MRDMNDRAADIAADDSDQPFGLQDPECLADTGRADAEFGKQFLLLWQKIAVGQCAGQDARTQAGPIAALVNSIGLHRIS
jgi:hypothetical protein